MTSESARMLANLAIIQSSNKSEAIVMLAEALGVIGNLPEQPVSSLQTVVEKRKEPSHETPKDKPSKAVSNEVMVRKGGICSCSVCGKDVYKITKDVYNTMKVAEFCACFTPTPGSPKLEKLKNFSNVDNCAMIDCPLCGAESGLVLWGSRPALKEGKGVSDVGSIGGEEYL